MDMSPHTITRTNAVTGTCTEETTIFGADPRRRILHVYVIGAGTLLVAVHNTATSHGFMVTATTPLILEGPIQPINIATSPAGGSVVYRAVEGLR